MTRVVEGQATLGAVLRWEHRLRCREAVTAAVTQHACHLSLWTWNVAGSNKNVLPAHFHIIICKKNIPMHVDTSVFTCSAGVCISSRFISLVIFSVSVKAVIHLTKRLFVHVLYKKMARYCWSYLFTYLLFLVEAQTNIFNMQIFYMSLFTELSVIFYRVSCTLKQDRGYN